MNSVDHQDTFNKGSLIPAQRTHLPSGWVAVMWLVLTPITVSLLLLMAIVSLPVGVVMAIGQDLRERKFWRRMRAAGRKRSWREIELRLQAGEGTLIIQQAQKTRVRIWWTPEGVLELAPSPPPPTEELDFLLLRRPHPFVAWCDHRYLEQDHGSAVLTKPTFDLPTGLFFAEFFRVRYPLAAVLDTVYCRR